MTKRKDIAAFAAGIGIGVAALGWLGGGDLNVGPTRAFTAPTSTTIPANDPAAREQTAPRIVRYRSWEDGSYRITVRLPAKPEYGLKARNVTHTGCRSDGLCR